MLVNLHHDSPAEHRRLLVAGVAFVALMATLVAFSVAVYLKVFEPSTRVTVLADRAGLQLPVNGDVRLRGVLVGRVASVDQDGEQAVIELALQPDAARSVPADVRVDILPTTLFGQKYVDLVVPDGEDPATPIADGATVPADRVRTNVELSQVLARLFPLLRSISPADLNASLGALADALEGRGEELGGLLVDTEDYLGRFVPRLPLVQEDLRLLADVADDYDAAAPDLLRLLENSTVTARTLVDQETELAGFLGDVTGLADTSARVLAENEQDLVRLGQLSRPLLALLETYSPQYPCLLRGLDRYTDRLSEIFQNARVNQVLELGSIQKEAYTAEDRPVYGEVGHGPWCATLPFPTGVVDTPLKDGSDADDPGNGSILPGLSSITGPLPGAPRPAPFGGARFANPTQGYAGTPLESGFLATVLAARTGRERGDFGSLASLLWGPQVRGSEVSG